MSNDWEDLVQGIEALRLQLSNEQNRVLAMREVLTWYADINNWQSRSGKVGITPVWVDMGARAKAVLLSSEKDVEDLAIICDDCYQKLKAAGWVTE